MKPIEEQIEVLKTELKNLEELWKKEIISISKDHALLINDKKRDKLFAEISDKYTPSIIEKQEELFFLEEKQNRGI